MDGSWKCHLKPGCFCSLFSEKNAAASFCDHFFTAIRRSVVEICDHVQPSDYFWSLLAGRFPFKAKIFAKYPH